MDVLGLVGHSKFKLVPICAGPVIWLRVFWSVFLLLEKSPLKTDRNPPMAFCTDHKTVLLLREFISQSSEKQLKRVYFYQSAIKSEAWLEKRAERRKREVTHQQVKGGVVSPKEDRGPPLYSLILRNDGKLDLQKWMMGMKKPWLLALGHTVWKMYEKCTFFSKCDNTFNAISTNVISLNLLSCKCAQVNWA